jgi:ribosomal protein L19
VSTGPWYARIERSFDKRAMPLSAIEVPVTVLPVHRAEPDRGEDFLGFLNAEQRLAVEHGTGSQKQDGGPLLVIARAGSGTRETITVRRIVQGEGVERKFPINSPRIAKIEVKRSGVTRRAKLYYLRDRTGKAVRLKERRVETDKRGKKAAKPAKS